MTETSLYAWVRQDRIDRGYVVGALTSEELEPTKPSKEVRELRMERDFLKKPAAYFAVKK